MKYIKQFTGRVFTLIVGIIVFIAIIIYDIEAVDRIFPKWLDRLSDKMNSWT